MKQFPIPKWYRNISIAKKLYFAVGTMALLIVIELFTLWFSINTLSAVRAFVGGEGLWSKGQKDAIYNLRKYVRSGKETDYQQYLNFLKVPLGDRIARIEMAKVNPDYDIIRRGFLQGHVHPNDIEGMNKLFRRFHGISYIHNAIQIWSQADSLLTDLQTSADRLHSIILVSGLSSPEKIEGNLGRIDKYNTELTILEDNFSAALGEGSRWLEHLVLKVLLSIAITVELTGIILGVSVSITITKGIKEIIRIAGKIQVGDFSERATIFSKDEIGDLSNSFNKMIDELEENVTAIQEGEEQLQTIFKNAPDAVVVINEESRVVRWNPRAETMFGWVETEVIGIPIHTIIIPERLRSAYHAEMEHFFKTKEGSILNKPLELRAVRKDKAEFDIGLSISPTILKGQHFFIGFISDISFRKTAEILIQQKSEELIRSNKELEQFAYVASHDLQEPLRIITSYVQLLEKGYKNKLDKDADTFIHFTVDAATRMHTLINDLLTYSRIGSLGGPFQKTDCNLILKIALENLKASINEHNAKIKIDMLPVINVDVTQMVQLFQNIIGNGIKFRGENNPEIKISAIDKTSHWMFSINDNGIGIQKEYLGKIFIIFQRLHTIADYPGTGIGLAICKKIIERHGGEIWAESEFGKGTTFYFTVLK